MRIAVALLLAACSTTPAQIPDTIRSCGHAHNDEDNARPLFEALEAGFCSIEVDVHLVGDQLLVAHDLEDTSPDRTLESMYLAPLAANPRELYLMIDVKSDPATTWDAIDDRLSRFDLGPVRVVITGGQARDRIAAAGTATMDARIADLDAGIDSALFPIVSDKWIDHFTWIGGVEPMPHDQKLKLRQLVARAHEGGHELRFWQTGERPEMWQALIDEGVDLINTDEIEAFSEFLKNR